jgi:hypothetical protein
MLMNARAIILSGLLVLAQAAPSRAQAILDDLQPAPASQVAPQWRPLPGPSLQNHAAAYDTRRHRIIAFEGWYDFPSDYAAEVPGNRAWALSLDGTPTWKEIVARGPAPSARIGHTEVYDPVRDRLLVFGGGNGVFGDPPYLNEVWALSLSGEPAWTRLEISGVLPPPRSGHRAIYDRSTTRWSYSEAAAVAGTSPRSTTPGAFHCPALPRGASWSRTAPCRLLAQGTRMKRCSIPSGSGWC